MDKKYSSRYIMILISKKFLKLLKSIYKFDEINYNNQSYFLIKKKSYRFKFFILFLSDILYVIKITCQISIRMKAGTMTNTLSKKDHSICLNLLKTAWRIFLKIKLL